MRFNSQYELRILIKRKLYYCIVRHDL